MLQFTRGFLWADSMPAGESAQKKPRRERHFMNKNELRCSGKHRRCAFANGTSEL